MPMAALEERIDQELIDNPVLEREDDIQNTDFEETAEKTDPNKPESETDVERKELVIEEGKDNADDFERLVQHNQEFPDSFDGPRQSANRVSESMDRQHDLMANVVDRSGTLQDHLTKQLHEMDKLSPELLKMCVRIVSALSAEDGGYLRVGLMDLIPGDSTPEKMELAEDALATVQGLEPVGVAARDLRECLLLQLRKLNKVPNLKQVRTLIQDHLEDLRDNRIPQIQKATGYTIEQIQDAWGELKTLDPKPASRFADRIVPTANPDLFLTKNEDGTYLVKMEEGPVRSLNISRYYLQRLANDQATAEEKEFIKRKITSAQWLIESIEQRRNTLTRVAQAIVEHQKNFLEEGGQEHLVPLKMQQIADIVGVHVTTVSRAVDDKWMETPRGILALREFFVGGTTSDNGEDIAWNKIRVALQKLIDEENKAKPYSDDELVKRLKVIGLNVARRTVTKYRKKMGIPSSRKRVDWSQKKS